MRCGDCKWYLADNDNGGTCRLASERDYQSDPPINFDFRVSGTAGCVGPCDLNVSTNFGCVLFEAK